MGYLSNSLRTGNPLLDGLISSLVIAAASYLFSNRRALIAELQRMLCQTSALASVTVMEHDTSSREGFTGTVSVTNLDYDSLIWYVTQVVPCFDGYAAKSLSFFESGKTKIRDSFLPVRNHPICIFRSVPPSRSDTGRGRGRGRGYFITLTYTYDIVGSESYHRDWRLILKYHGSNGGWNIRRFCRETGDPIPIKVLREFMVGVRTDYVARLRSQDWRQQLFRLHVAREDKRGNARSGGGKVSWKGSPTHSSKTFDTVVLDDDTKARLVHDLHSFLDSETWYATMGLSYRRGYMFYGPPGTGKTSLVLAAANAARYDIYALDLSKLRDDGELEDAFEAMPEKCLIIMEDVDCMHVAVRRRTTSKIEERRKSDGGYESHINDSGDGLPEEQDHHAKPLLTLSSLLNSMDGVANNHGRIFVLTTNHPERLDPALVRPGRVDHSLHLGMCSRTQVYEFFDLYYGIDGVSRLRDTETKLLAAYPSSSLPGEGASPAHVSSVLQQFKNDPAKAVEVLSDVQGSRGGDRLY